MGGSFSFALKPPLPILRGIRCARRRGREIRLHRGGCLFANIYMMDEACGQTKRGLQESPAPFSASRGNRTPGGSTQHHSCLITYGNDPGYHYPIDAIHAIPTKRTEYPGFIEAFSVRASSEALFRLSYAYSIIFNRCLNQGAS